MLVWTLVVLGILIIAGLSVYAGMLLSRLRKQNRASAETTTKRNDYLYDSIRTIAVSMQQEQCPLSEGCIRITVLLDHFPDAEERDLASKFPSIHGMYERIKHMPTHDARKTYPKAEIRAMDKEREGYEKELEKDIQADVKEVISWVEANWKK